MTVMQQSWRRFAAALAAGALLATAGCNTPPAYQVTRRLLHEKAKQDSIVLHSLPRMDELTPDVDSTRHARYWAEALAAQTADAALAATFAPVAEALVAAEAQIVEELAAAQGEPVDLGGYYAPDEALAVPAMRPSATLNAIIDSIA